MDHGPATAGAHGGRDYGSEIDRAAAALREDPDDSRALERVSRIAEEWIASDQLSEASEEERTIRVELARWMSDFAPHGKIVHFGWREGRVAQALGAAGGQVQSYLDHPGRAVAAAVRHGSARVQFDVLDDAETAERAAADLVVLETAGATPVLPLEVAQAVARAGGTIAVVGSPVEVPEAFVELGAFWLDPEVGVRPMPPASCRTRLSLYRFAGVRPAEPSPPAGASRVDGLTPLEARVDSKASYAWIVEDLKRRHSDEQALRLAVGGAFDRFGVIQRDLCLQYGLPPDGYLIDVGCGSGRLATKMAAFPRMRYLGIDVLPEFVDYARSLAGRDDFRFAAADGWHIPESNDQADFVVFFSVFTHLLHEQSYLYLTEATRVLRPGGRIVFSFHEFRMPGLWKVFERSVASVNDRNQLHMFMSREQIEVWAEHLGVTVETIEDGDRDAIRLTSGFTLEDGTFVEPESAALGQSFCVLRA